MKESAATRVQVLNLTIAEGKTFGRAFPHLVKQRDFLSKNIKLLSELEIRMYETLAECEQFKVMIAKQKATIDLKQITYFTAAEYENERLKGEDMYNNFLKPTELKLSTQQMQVNELCAKIIAVLNAGHRPRWKYVEKEE